MSKPHCYGEMNWILKYHEDHIPNDAICDCEYTNSCLRLTRNKQEVQETQSDSKIKRIHNVGQAEK